MRARYSNDERYVHRAKRWRGSGARCRQLLLCRAALGAAFDFGEAIDRDVTKPPAESPGVLYDSVRGGPHRPTCAGPGDDDSPVFVLYDLTQVIDCDVLRRTVCSS